MLGYGAVVGERRRGFRLRCEGVGRSTISISKTQGETRKEKNGFKTKEIADWGDRNKYNVFAVSVKSMSNIYIYIFILMYICIYVHVYICIYVYMYVPEGPGGSNIMPLGASRTQTSVNSRGLGP